MKNTTAVQTRRINEDVITIEVDVMGIVIAEGFFNHATNQCYDWNVVGNRISRDEMFDLELDVEYGRLIVY